MGVASQPGPAGLSAGFLLGSAMSVAQTFGPSTLDTSTPPGVRRIVLTGFMGAGKSTVGRLLAAELDWRFLDLDHLIEEHSGSTVSALFTTIGEAGFRRLESLLLARSLGQQQVVIALGGGAPETQGNRLLVEQTPGTRVVFLRAPFPALFDRCMLEAVASGSLHRPNLQDPLLAETRYRDREILYRRLAHSTVDTLQQTPEQTVAAVRVALARR